jgi:toxin-antitoxin system PIN domain toxin
MPSLCDVNVLLALVYGRHQFHSQAVAWLDGMDTEAGIIVCRQTQLGLLRLLSTRAVMEEDVLSPAQCWGVFDVMMADHRFAFMREPRDMEPHFRHAMRGRLSSPKLWQDAYLASFARAAGLQIVTFDAGFQQFAGVETNVLR